MSKTPQEWFAQSDYDMDTAEFMFSGGRYFYAVFMCHLSIEKALKGLYSHKLKEATPKNHNLIYLVEKLGLDISNDLYTFIFTINRISVPTRYPDNLKRALEDYSKEKTGEILQKSKVLLEWLKTKL